MKPSTCIRWYIMSNKQKSSDMQQPTGFANFTASNKSDQLYATANMWKSYYSGGIHSNKQTEIVGFISTANSIC